MGVIIVLAFRLQSYFVNYAYELRRQGVKTGKIITILESLSMSGIVVIVNVILRLVVLILEYRFNNFQELRNIIRILNSTVHLPIVTFFCISLILLLLFILSMET